MRWARDDVAPAAPRPRPDEEYHGGRRGFPLHRIQWAAEGLAAHFPSGSMGAYETTGKRAHWGSLGGSRGGAY